MVDLVDVHPHQQAQRLRGDVVRGDGRATRVVSEIRIHLRLEHRLGKRTGWLGELHHPGAGGIPVIPQGEWTPRLLDINLCGVEQFEQFIGLEGVALVSADHEGIRCLVPRHPVAVDLVVVLHPRGAVLRDLFQRGEHRRVPVVDDVAQPPDALVVRYREVHSRILRPQGYLDTGRVHERVSEPGAGDLGQDARLPVVEHVLPGRGPQVVLLAVHHPALTLRDQGRGHRRSDLGLPLEQQRMDVRVVRVLVRGHKNAGAAGPHLVHVVGHLRLEFAVNVQRQTGFDLGEHEPVTVVVVARVVVIQVRVCAAKRRVFGVVPVVDDQYLAVWVLRRHDH